VELSIATTNAWLLKMASLLPHYLCVAIGETLYCHDKCLVAKGGLSIATLNIVVGIGYTLYCHDKCLVAKDGLSIATINTWLL
jgi:hypothetical protein